MQAFTIFGRYVTQKNNFSFAVKQRLNFLYFIKIATKTCDFTIKN